MSNPPTFNPSNATFANKNQALDYANKRDEHYSTTRSGVPKNDYTGSPGLANPTNSTGTTSSNMHNRGGRRRRRTVRRRSIRRRYKSSRRRRGSRRR